MTNIRRTYTFRAESWAASFTVMVARDASRAAAELQDDIQRRFSPAERPRMAIEMSEFARSLSRAGLRSRPELTERSSTTGHTGG